MLRLIDLRTGKPVPTRRERWEAAQEELARLKKAKIARNGK